MSARSEGLRVAHFLLQFTHPVLLAVFPSQRHSLLADVFTDVLTEFEGLGSVDAFWCHAVPQIAELLTL